jgi:hypothetical protein
MTAAPLDAIPMAVTASIGMNTKCMILPFVFGGNQPLCRLGETHN